jgi:hypothetical protein
MKLSPQTVCSLFVAAFVERARTKRPRKCHRAFLYRFSKKVGLLCHSLVIVGCSDHLPLVRRWPGGLFSLPFSSLFTRPLRRWRAAPRDPLGLWVAHARSRRSEERVSFVFFPSFLAVAQRIHGLAQLLLGCAGQLVGTLPTQWEPSLSRHLRDLVSFFFLTQEKKERRCATKK